MIESAPLVSSIGLRVLGGAPTQPVDPFAHSFRDTVRQNVSRTPIEMRRQGLSGAAMPPVPGPEHTGIAGNTKDLDKLFAVGGAAGLAAA